MSLAGGGWRVWRDAPGFCQRFTGRLGEDGGTIAGLWEKSSDGEIWQHDFDWSYRRVRR